MNPRGGAQVSRLLFSAAILLPASCASTPGAPSRGANVEVRSTVAQPRAEILSARLTQRAPSEGDVDELLVVFSEHIDASSLDPAVFMVIRGDGRGVQPRRAVLGPADEDDENRSVTLVGTFSDDALGAPVAVHVVGELFAESGAELRSRDGIVRGPEVPDDLVYAEALSPSAGACGDAEQLVRTYWSDVLDGVELEDLSRVHLLLVDGTEITPSGFDDHDFDDRAGSAANPGPTPGEAGEVVTVPNGLSAPREDNVLDLCVAAKAAVSAISVDGAAFRDRGGLATAATRAPVSGP